MFRITNLVRRQPVLKKPYLPGFPLVAIKSGERSHRVTNWHMETMF